jgi:hypothetical protein
VQICNIEKEKSMDYVIIKKIENCEITISFQVSNNKKEKLRMVE